MARKARKQKVKHQKVSYESIEYAYNNKAIMPDRKTWSVHDLKSIKPLTVNQETVFYDWFDGKHLFIHGSAGTGKSFISMYLALVEVLKENQKNIIIVRSAVPTRDQGFLPGTIEEKEAVYELPYISIFADLIGRNSTYHDMKRMKKIKFITTSNIRGLTWDDSIIVVEEFQNMTNEEFDSVMTRVGKNSRIIITGDTKKQNDLITKRGAAASGVEINTSILKRMPEFSSVEFSVHDIVRSEFVKSWIIASEEIAA